MKAYSKTIPTPERITRVKTLANEPAFPLFSPVLLDGKFTDNFGITAGLTKREYFAGLAMQGIIGKSGLQKIDPAIKDHHWYRATAIGSVAYAEALLAELERKA